MKVLSVRGTTISSLLLLLSYWNMSSKEPRSGGTRDDCFLFNFFPFLKTIFPQQQDIIQESTPRGLPVDTASSAANSSMATNKSEEDDYEATPLDFANTDYRGFIFAIHPDHGYILLHCTRKKKKPNHFQLPGGHIDDFEFKAAAQATQDPKEQLTLAGKMGAARELFEETGLDIRNSLDRFEPAKLYPKEKKNKLCNEFKHRLFYTIELADDDFLKEENLPIADAAFLQRAMGAQPPNLKVSTSLLLVEHDLLC